MDKIPSLCQIIHFEAVLDRLVVLTAAFLIRSRAVFLGFYRIAIDRVALH